MGSKKAKNSALKRRILGYLARVGLSQPNKWESPTILDHFLLSPVRLITIIIYQIYLKIFSLCIHTARFILSLIPDSFRPVGYQKPRTLRVVCISDTHDAQIPLPDGDLLIHAGDMTDSGSAADIQKQLDWLKSQPHEHIVVIGGNHDSYLDSKSKSPEDRKSGVKLNYGRLNYLAGGGVTLNFYDGRKVKVFGMPDVPVCGPANFAFQYGADKAPWKDTVPKDTDILVTHTPPKFFRDLYGLGCPSLRAELYRVRPALHVFGHVHRGAGREFLPISPIHKLYNELLMRPCKGVVHDLLSVREWIWTLLVLALSIAKVVVCSPLVLGHLVCNSYYGRKPQPTVLVNAAQQVGSTGKTRGKVEVVDLELADDKKEA